MFPAYENILIKFSKYNFSFDLMLGQLEPITNEKNLIINRNISGHRLNVDLSQKLNFSIGEQIIYTGENRSLELKYLNPYIPYFLNGLEKYGEYENFDNDNSIIFRCII